MPKCGKSSDSRNDDIAAVEIKSEETEQRETAQSCRSSEPTAGPSRMLEQLNLETSNSAILLNKGKGKEKAAREHSFELFDIPIAADLSDLLPIIDTSGKIRGFVTVQQGITGPNFEAPEVTSLANTVCQHQHETITVPARLVSSDKDFLNSGSIHPSADHAGLRIRRSNIRLQYDDGERSHHANVDPTDNTFNKRHVSKNELNGDRSSAQSSTASPTVTSQALIDYDPTICLSDTYGPPIDPALEDDAPSRLQIVPHLPLNPLNTNFSKLLVVMIRFSNGNISKLSLSFDEELQGQCFPDRIKRFSLSQIMYG
jgi:hypothetical protein